MKAQLTQLLNQPWVQKLLSFWQSRNAREQAGFAAIALVLILWALWSLTFGSLLAQSARLTQATQKAQALYTQLQAAPTAQAKRLNTSQAQVFIEQTLQQLALNGSLKPNPQSQSFSVSLSTPQWSSAEKFINQLSLAGLSVTQLKVNRTPDGLSLQLALSY